jgi:hypothetical protein
MVGVLGIVEENLGRALAALEVLGHRRYRMRAEQVRDEMQRLPEPEYAVTLLEQLTAGKRRDWG